MPEQKLQLLRGDRAGTDTEYRNYIPQNMNPIVHKVFDVEGYMSTHPGYETYITDDGIGTDRGALYNERFKEHYRVSGNNFIRVNADETIDVLGTVTGDGGLRFRAALPYSFNSQLIVTDTKAWMYTPTEGFFEITDVDLGNPIDACWIDGYYFFTDGEFLYHSELNEDPPSDPGAFIEPLKYATSEMSPDDTRGVGRTQDNQLIVFNRYTTEFFYNAGQEGFVFARVEGKATNVGIIDAGSKIQVTGTWYTLGSSKESEPTFNIIGAGTYTNFSNREVDEILQGYADDELRLTTMAARKVDQQQYIYVQMVRHILMFNITAAQTVGKEHAWSVLTTGTEIDASSLPPLRYAQAVDGAPREAINPVWDPAVNRWICGKYTGENTLVAITEESAAQEGETAQMMVTSPFVYGEALSIDEIKIRTLPGQADGIVGAFISLTYDGVTFSKEWSMKISKDSGDYNRRFEVRRLGYIRDYVGFRLRIVSRNKVALCDMRVVYS